MDEVHLSTRGNFGPLSRFSLERDTSCLTDVEILIKLSLGTSSLYLHIFRKYKVLLENLVEKVEGQINLTVGGGRVVK